MGVAYRHTERWVLSAHLAYSCHDNTLRDVRRIERRMVAASPLRPNSAFDRPESGRFGPPQPNAGHIGSLSADVDRHQPDRR
jgi:hypothetical protein